MGYRDSSLLPTFLLYVEYSLFASIVVVIVVEFGDCASTDSGVGKDAINCSVSESDGGGKIK